MTPTFNITLTDELSTFVDQQTGPGTIYTTRSEYSRGLIREKMERVEAATLRSAVLEGYSDIRAGRVHTYDGDLNSLMNQSRAFDLG